MRNEPLAPARVLAALELFGPQARPYNFDDHFDCWGLARKVFDWIDDGFELNGEAVDASTASNWAPLVERSGLVPGDLLATHAQPDPTYHVAFYCGRVGEHELVYDSSPRGSIPLLGEGRELVGARELSTKYARATETTDRLRDGGGAYLRLWHDGMRFFHRGLHERLIAGGAAEARDLVALRRAAGLAALPFYVRRELARDERGREVYDNAATRRLDYYVPDGAPVPDDRYENLVECPGAVPPGTTARADVPEIVVAPDWACAAGPLEVVWRHRRPEDVVGCRVELWEETWDLWRHRLARRDLDGPATAYTVPEELLHPDSRFAVVVFARGVGGFSGSAVAPFLYRPAPGDPLLGRNPARPSRLVPDDDEVVDPEGLELRWRVREPRVHQAAAEIALFCDAGRLADGTPPVFRSRVEGEDAGAGRCAVPTEVLRPGARHYWHVTPIDTHGRAAFAPTEGVFRVRRGV